MANLRIKDGANVDAFIAAIGAGTDGDPFILRRALPADQFAALASEATLTAVLAALASVAVTGPVTDAELRAAPVPVSISATPRTIVAVSINATSSGDNTVVAAVPGNRIRLIACHLHGNGDVNVSWKSGAATTLAAPMPLGVKGNGFVLPHAPTGEYWQRTASGEALVLTLSAAVAVTGSLIYELEAA